MGKEHLKRGCVYSRRQSHGDKVREQNSGKRKIETMKQKGKGTGGDWKRKGKEGDRAVGEETGAVRARTGK